MADVSEIRNLTPERLEKVQAVLDLFRLLGLSDEEISLLPQVLKNWPIVVSNINAFSSDLVAIKSDVARLSVKRAGQDTGVDTEENIRESIGFGNHPEIINFGTEGSK